MRFVDKIVLVTGGTRGIGARMVEDFAAAGASVIATGTDAGSVSQLNASSLYNVRYVAADFSTRSGIRSFAQIVATLDVDVLVNNAGINKIHALEEIPEDDWDAIRSVNLDAPLLLMKAVAPHMKARGYGRIVNVGSVFGVVSRAKRAPYSATKFGLHGLTRAAALELAPFGVLVNTLSPGFVRTDLTERILGREAMEKLVNDIPVGRLAVPADISSAVLFLASDVNTYITGHNLVADGGFISG